MRPVSSKQKRPGARAVTSSAPRLRGMTAWGAAAGGGGLEATADPRPRRAQPG